MEDEKTPVATEETTEEVTTTEEVVIPEATLKAAAEAGAKAALEARDEVERKNIGNADDAINGAAGGEISKEVKFVRYLKALAEGDVASLKALNTGTGSEGGFTVPPSELLAEVMRLEETVGVALQDANIKRVTKGNTFTVIKITGEVEMYETAELEEKTTDQPTFAEVEVALRKFAVIVPFSEELEEDSAVNIFNEVAMSIARARSKKADQLVFTDATNGITKISGTNIVSVVGANFADVTYEHLVDAVYGIPSSSSANGSWYMHRTLMGVIMKIRDDNDELVFANPKGDIQGATLLGRPVKFVEVMPALSQDALNTGFIVYGDLRYFTLGIKSELKLKVLEEGTVGSGEDAINLASQDARALRGVARMNGKASFASAFSVIKTAASS